MANGRLPGSVAPIQQSRSYSDILGEQVAMVQQQRAANLEKRLAQDEKNREFRQQQQQNIYDFDVSGLPQAYIEEIGKLQNQMAAWLDPNAEVHYENSQQLTRDIAKLNNIYMSGKRLAAGGQAAMKNYEDRMTGKVKVPGVASAATEETYKNRKDAYDRGGFGSMEIVGGPGEFTIMGLPLSEGENGMWGVAEGAEQVDILSAQIDPDSLFRQEEIRDFINVEQKYVDASSPEMAEKQAESDFNSNPASIQAEFRAKLAAEDPSYLERNDDGEYKKGADELLILYKEEAKSGWDKFHETQLPTSLLGGSDVVTEYGRATKLTDPKTGKDRTVSLYTGGETRKVNHIGFRGQGENTEVFYVYQDPNDPNQYFEAVVPYNSAEGFSLINDAGAIGTIAQLVGNADLTLEELRDSVEKAPAATEGAPEGAAATTTEGEGGEGTGERREGSEAEDQQSAPAPDTIGEFRASLDGIINRSSIRESRDQKLANEIKNQSVSTQIARIDEEIASIEEDLKNTPTYKRGVGSKYRRDMAALDRLKELKKNQPEGLDTEEAKTARIDTIESRMADIDVELLELQGRGTQKAKDRRKLEEEKANLRGEISQLDPDYYAATQLPSERPEVTAAAGPAIQGQGPGIAYSKPQPPQDIDAFEVGDSKAGSTKEEREVAFKEAVRMAEEAGHPYPEAVAAQYALESGYGKKKAANYNYFGLKSSDAMIKRLAEAGIEATAGDPVATEEIIDGKSQTINDSFLSFKSPEDAFMAYLMFIDTTKKDGERRYGEALDESETALDYLKGIREAGYATATNYADSLNTVAKSFGIDLAEIERKPVGTASN
jgi:flagellum-specific peptidoglycan hydrolase FlgJ